MHISDVHLGHHRGSDYLAKIVEAANAQEPDVILLNGDLVDSNVALRPEEFAPLSQFRAPVYFVGGNHENYIDSARTLELILGSGVKILHNESVQVAGIELVGLDYMNADENAIDLHPSTDKRTIKSVLAGMKASEAVPSVLMHHSPVGSQYAEAAGYDLMLSGHTHGGQLFPGTLLAKLIFPFNRGIYERNRMKGFVSQGAGTYMARIRLGTSNEIDLLRLQPSTRRSR